MITLRLDKNGGINKGDVVFYESDNISEKYVIQLYKNNKIYDLTGKTIELTIVEKKRKYGNIFNLPIENATEGKFRLLVTSDISKECGLYDFKVTVKDDIGLVETFPSFQVEVLHDLTRSIASEIVNSDDFEILTEGLKALSDYNIYKTNAMKVPSIEENIKVINSSLDTKTNIKNNIKVINVNEYGIKTDGTAYDSINLENIILENVCTYFSNVGDYLFNNITLSNKNNIIINGENSNIVFKSTSQFSNCNNLTFKNVNFINRNSVNDMLIFNNCSNVKFINCTLDGINICKNGVTFENCSNIQIYDSTIKNFSYRYGIEFMNCEETKVNNCCFKNIGGSGVAFKWGNNGCYVHNSIFEDCCKFDWSNGGGTDGVIDFYGAFDVYGKNSYGLISGNRIKGFGVTSITTNAIRVISSDYITVENNIISGGVGNCNYLTVGDRVRASDKVLFDSNGCNFLNNTLILDNTVNMFIDISGKVSSCNVTGNKILNNGGNVINEWSASIRITQTTESSNCVNIENNCLGNENSRLPLSGIIIGKANVNTTIKNNYIYTLHTPLSITTGTGVIVEGNWFGSELNDSAVNNVTNGIIKNNIRCFNRTFNTESNTNVLIGDTLDNY